MSIKQQLYIVPHDCTFEGDSYLYPHRENAIPFVPGEEEQFALKRLREHYYAQKIEGWGIDRTPNEDGSTNGKVLDAMDEATRIVGGWVVDERTLNMIEYVGANCDPGDEGSAYMLNHAIKMAVHSLAVDFIGERFTSDHDEVDVVGEGDEQLPDQTD